MNTYKNQGFKACVYSELYLHSGKEQAARKCTATRAYRSHNMWKKKAKNLETEVLKHYNLNSLIYSRKKQEGEAESQGKRAPE